MTATNTDGASAWGERPYTAAAVLANGLIIEGYGVGAVGEAAGEVCFNTAITGYQEILTDPSYAGQIVMFTFPHIGNIGANPEDIETANLASASGVRGCISARPGDGAVQLQVRTAPRSSGSARAALSAYTGIDTRALTMLIREHGMPNAIDRPPSRWRVRFRRAAGPGAGLPEHGGS